MNSTNNDGAGLVKVWENPDMPWIVSTNTITGEMLSQVKANPKVFTPNNDGKNDFTVLQFILSLTRTKVKINIFSTEGTLVRSLYDGTLEAHAYTDDRAPGRWDGKNKDGDLVPPGIYIFQVIADTDEGVKAKTGTVVVAY
jgi:flagellar hook assembly protein FlgD